VLCLAISHGRVLACALHAETSERIAVLTLGDSGPLPFLESGSEVGVQHPYRFVCNVRLADVLTLKIATFGFRQWGSSGEGFHDEKILLYSREAKGVLAFVWVR
jgi:hypothetical protein